MIRKEAYRVPQGPANDIAPLIGEIDANLTRAESITAGLSEQQFNWRPEPGRWSIAQAIAHLNVVNGQDLPALRQSIDAGRARQLTGTGPFAYGFLSRKFVASMEPPVTRKFKAPKEYEPPTDAGLDQTLTAYRAISADVRRLVQAAEGLHLARVKTTLSTLPAIIRAVVKMPLGARFALITTHDRRHLWQAEQVRKHPRFPPFHA